MKKLKKLPSAAVSKSKSAARFVHGRVSVKTVLVVLISFGLGVGATLGVQHFTTKQSPSSTNSASKQTLSPEAQSKFAGQRIETGYKRTKTQIADDLKNGRLTQAQADKLNQKVDEIHDYLKQNIDDKSKTAEISKKRQEWRDWAKQNDVPSSYITRMY